MPAEKLERLTTLWTFLIALHTNRTHHTAPRKLFQFAEMHETDSNRVRRNFVIYRNSEFGNEIRPTNDLERYFLYLYLFLDLLCPMAHSGIDGDII